MAKNNDCVYKGLMSIAINDVSTTYHSDVNV